MLQILSQHGSPGRGFSPPITQPLTSSASESTKLSRQPTHPCSHPLYPSQFAYRMLAGYSRWVPAADVATSPALVLEKRASPSLFSDLRPEGTVHAALIDKVQQPKTQLAARRTQNQRAGIKRIRAWRLEHPLILVQCSSSCQFGSGPCQP